MISLAMPLRRLRSCKGSILPSTSAVLATLSIGLSGIIISCEAEPGNEVRPAPLSSPAWLAPLSGDGQMSAQKAGQETGQPGNNERGSYAELAPLWDEVLRLRQNLREAKQEQASMAHILDSTRGDNRSLNDRIEELEQENRSLQEQIEALKSIEQQINQLEQRQELE